MKIACICSTKNEGDVIEAFVRLNGRICDSFFFVDDSTDKTRQILDLLAKEHHDINFLPSSRIGYNQPNATKALISAVLRRMNPDWIFLLDADEIIVTPDKRLLLEEMQTVPPNAVLAAPWHSFVPTSTGYFESCSPLSDCFAVRKDKVEPFRKVSMSGRLAEDVVPTAGNHHVQSLTGASLTERPPRSYYLAHFPVRSSAQIIVKNLMATHNLTRRTDALKGEGFHVFPIRDLIRSRDYALTLRDLQEMAITYSCLDQTPPVSIASELDPTEVPQLKTMLSHLALGKIDPLARLDFEVERLSNELRGMRRGFRLDGLNFRAVNPRSVQADK
jgi:hypothetical protein